MRFQITSAFLMLGLAGCATHSPTENPTSLKVMTYNIRVGKGGGEWNNDPTKINLEPVAKLIAAEAPDVVGLQEVDRFQTRTSLMNQPEELSSRLNMHAAFQPSFTTKMDGGKDQEYGNALLSRFPIHSSRRFALFKPDYSKTNPKYPDYYSEQRGLLHAEILLRGKPVHIFVTHLGLTADQREKQIEEILETMDRHKGPKILMGDFNARPEEPALKLITREYTEVLSAVNATDEERKTFPAGLKPNRAIDYIFVSAEFEVLKARVIRDASLASDHNPVIAEIRLRQ